MLAFMTMGMVENVEIPAENFADMHKVRTGLERAFAGRDITIMAERKKAPVHVSTRAFKRQGIVSVFCVWKRPSDESARSDKGHGIFTEAVGFGRDARSRTKQFVGSMTFFRLQPTRSYVDRG